MTVAGLLCILSREERKMSTAEHLQDTETWKRGFFMMVFVIIYTAAELLVFGIVVFSSSRGSSRAN